MYHNVFLNFELFLKKERIHAKNLQELKINILTKYQASSSNIPVTKSDQVKESKNLRE